MNRERRRKNDLANLIKHLKGFEILKEKLKQLESDQKNEKSDLK